MASAWSTIQLDNPRYTSPYFSLDFTKAVSQVRDDVELFVIKNERQEIVGLFPFQRTSAKHAEPVGGRLNDVHGLIAFDEVMANLSPADFRSLFLRQAQLNSVGFHSAHGDDVSFAAHRFRELQSHHLDLQNGWESYYAWSKQNSSTIKRHGQKARALGRDLGEVRFEFHSDDANVLERLIELKRSKYRRTRTFDILSVDWASELLRKIHQVQQPKFKGILSVLWAGDKLVAMHIGMQTENILHYWFPVFDPKFSKYSPGTELLLRVAKQASEWGIEKLDLGYGDDPYKFRFANATETVNCGLITDSSSVFQIAQARFIWRQRLKKIPMKATVKRVLRKVYPGFGGWNFK